MFSAHLSSMPALIAGSSEYAAQGSFAASTMQIFELLAAQRRRHSEYDIPASCSSP
jgi:hypothetical protein